MRNFFSNWRNLFFIPYIEICLYILNMRTLFFLQKLDDNIAKKSQCVGVGLSLCKINIWTTSGLKQILKYSILVFMSPHLQVIFYKSLFRLFFIFKLTVRFACGQAEVLWIEIGNFFLSFSSFSFFFPIFSPSKLFAEVLARHTYGMYFYAYLINNRRMFNLGIDDLAEKTYIPPKSLLQWIYCKCLAW